MSTLSIVFLVCFVVTMLLWLLSMLNGPNVQLKTMSPWLAWFACLFLGLAIWIR